MVPSVPVLSRWASSPRSTQVTISMFWWPCVPNPPPPRTTSSLLTISSPCPVLRGSWWGPKLKLCHESSQSSWVWKRLAAGRMSTVILAVCPRTAAGIGVPRLRPMPHLVTLCTGNAARSVMAGAILAEHVPAVVVATRGTHVIEGMPMSWRTRDAIMALGASADGHRSRQLEAADLVRADLVLAMAREHVQYVRRRYPDAA